MTRLSRDDHSQGVGSRGLPPLPTTQYLSTNEFEALVRTARLPDIVREHILTGHPYVFRQRPADYALMRGHLSERLRVAERNIQIVGSARTGFSVAPNGFPRRFRATSDVDVVVVSEELFDHIWLTLLSWHYPRRYRLPQPDHGWGRSRQDDLYWGWFTLDRLTDFGLSFRGALSPIRDLAAIWFDAFGSLSTHPSLASLAINGRLYRTWEHALAYHVDGLTKLRDRLP
jgi:hypothetical protein